MSPITLALFALCLSIAFCDLRMMRLPNVISLLLVCLFAAQIALEGGGAWVWPQLALSGIVFVLCFCAFAARLMGGGDAKVLPALALFAPVSALPEVLFGFGLISLLAIVAITLARTRYANPESDWAVWRSSKLPLGVPIGMAGCATILVGS